MCVCSKRVIESMDESVSVKLMMMMMMKKGSNDPKKCDMVNEK